MKRKTWRSKLNKKDLKHLKEVAKCTTLAMFKRTVLHQEKDRKKFPDPGNEPCWECLFIARKLGLIT